MRVVKRLAIVVVATLAGAGATPVGGTPPVAVETHVVLRVDALSVEGDRSSTVATAPETEVGPRTPAAIELLVPWGAGRAAVTVRLAATLTSLSGDGDAVLRLESTVVRPGKENVAASRELRLAEEGSGLFDVFGEGGRHLILALHGERVARAVIRPPLEVGAPVQFVVAVERVDGDRVVLLETNELHTFVGQAVEYSFRRGQDAALETVRLSVNPAAITGDVVTIDAEIDGALPGPAGAVLVSHHESIVASRHATSRLAATTGTPPAGYQFQVTPDF
jgi:hypothetical protein